MKAYSLVVIIFISWIISGCYYRDETDIETEPVNNNGDVISFSTDVLPIFESKCALSGCHVTGEHSPNLESGVAYNELFTNNLINVQDPESSELLIRMRSTTDPMPTDGKLTNIQINKIALWIEQGAKNN